VYSKEGKLMRQNGRTRPAVLGLVGLGFKTGYTIKQATEDFLSVVWRESYGNLYPVLKQLVEEGRLQVHQEGDLGRPPRQVHALTESGEEELGRWLEEPGELEPPRQEILLKILVAAESRPEAALRQVLNLRAQLTVQLEELRKRKVEGKAERLAAEYGLAVAEAQAAWCERVLEELVERGLGR
jgi:DNA-binding PadR family transcriptional regulator